jgi:hypothetical protein
LNVEAGLFRFFEFGEFGPDHFGATLETSLSNSSCIVTAQFASNSKHIMPRSCKWRISFKIVSGPDPNDPRAVAVSALSINAAITSSVCRGPWDLPFLAA